MQYSRLLYGLRSSGVLGADETFRSLHFDPNIGALIVRIGFGGILYYSSNTEPPKLLIIEAPTLHTYG